MKLIKKLFTVLAASALLAGSLMSCSNLSVKEDYDNEFPIPYGRVAFDCSTELTDIKLKGTKDGNTTTFGEWATVQALKDATINVPVGTWTFKLSATYDGDVFKGTCDGIITSGQTTALTFNLVRGGTAPVEETVDVSFKWYFADYAGDYTYTDNKYTVDSGKSVTLGKIVVTGQTTLSDKDSVSDNAEKVKGYVQLGNQGDNTKKNIKVSLSEGTKKIVVWAKCGTGDTEANASKTSAILKVSGITAEPVEFVKGGSWVATTYDVDLKADTDVYFYNGGSSTAGSLNIAAIIVTGEKTVITGGDDDDDDDNDPPQGGGTGTGGYNPLPGGGSTNVGESGTPGTVETTGSVTFKSQGSWNETLYATWDAISEADAYTVSYSTDNTNWTKVDNELVRAGWKERVIENFGLSYTDKTYSLWRVDIPGVKFNTKYYVKVQPTKSGANVGNAAVFSATTGKYVRNGYAFFNRTTTGAYKEDGTLADDAVVVYVTDATKNSVKATVNGSEVTGLVDVFGKLAETAKEKAHSKTPVAVRFLGTVTIPTSQGTSSKSGDIMNTSLTYLLSKYNDNITFEGVGPGAMLYGWGLTVKVGSNIEVRNLSFNMQKEDALSFEDTVLGAWIHNNDIYIGANGGGDKKKGDGGCDLKADSNWFSISYNHFVSTGKSSLCGMKGDSAPENVFVTFSNNWFDKCGSRCPRVRRYNVHVVNNYFDHNYSAGLAATEGANIFVQNNYFEDVNQPAISASQGHSIKTDGSDFNSGNDGGVIKMHGNIMAECPEGSVSYINGDLATVSYHYRNTDRFTGAREYTDAMKVANSKGFYPAAADAFMANTRDEKVPETFYALKGGAKYTNWDTDPAKCYTDEQFGLLAASAVKENCKKNTGRIPYSN